MTDDSDKASEGPKGFVGYAAEREPEVQAFQEQAYPQRTPDSILPVWRWMLVDSAKRLGIEPYIWMYRKKGRVVAHQGAIAVRLKLGQAERITGWFVETMAAEEIRGSPIGPMLIQKALEDLPCNLSLGQTSQMRELQFALGWQHVCDLRNWLFVCNSGLRLGDSPTDALMAWLVTRRHALRLARHRRDFERRGWQVTRPQRFSSEHDDLWQRASADLRVSVVRDAAYLNWKYLQRPDAGFGLIELRMDGVLRGVAVVLSKEPDAAYAYRRGFVIDLVVPASDVAAVNALLLAAVDVLSAESVITVSCQLGHPALEVCLRRFGFINRGVRHQLLIASGGLSAEEQTLINDPQAWFISMGDSDVDLYPG